jgi:hypothetical protein
MLFCFFPIKSYLQLHVDILTSIMKEGVVNPFAGWTLGPVMPSEYVVIFYFVFIDLT